MNWLKRVINWLFKPTKEELPDPCKPVFEELERIQKMKEDRGEIPSVVESIDDYISAIIPSEEGVKAFTEEIEKSSKLEDAQEYTEKLAPVYEDTLSGLSIVDPITIVPSEESSSIKIKDDSLISKKKKDIKIFDPKEATALNEEKATQIKKARKPRKKNGNK